MIEVWKPKSRVILEHRFLNEWLNFAKFLEEESRWVSYLPGTTGGDAILTRRTSS